MIRPGWKRAFGIVAAAACLAAPSRSEAVPYYTATYVGTGQDLDDSGASPGMIVNRTTGAAYPFAQTWIPIDSQPAGFFDGLPTNRVYQGATYPILTTYTMRPTAMTTSGIVLGQIPTNRSSNPWVDPAVGYTVRNADGTFGGFVELARYGNYYGYPLLSEAGRILINRRDFGWSLHDVKTGLETPLRDLVPPELLAKYAATPYATAIDDRGDILVDFYSNYATRDADVYILTPPGLEAPTPVPEPSTFGVAAATIAGLACRARRRRDR
ncbi:MAG: hypothetical protein BGO49_14705 [Planctomycetales bacterium 71-10]|nr:MAG: hypothetical protein BGO49_14705 [Planctomycetales bacterium 71-10]